MGALVPYSAALCRGLIEAMAHDTQASTSHLGIPRLYAAASLKHDGSERLHDGLAVVFRGFMPRPH